MLLLCVAVGLFVGENCSIKQAKIANWLKRTISKEIFKKLAFTNRYNRRNKVIFVVLYIHKCVLKKGISYANITCQQQLSYLQKLI